MNSLPQVSNASASVAPGNRDMVQSIDYLELYVGNAYQSAYYFQTGLGFKLVQRAGLDTGCADATRFLLANGNVRLIVTSALRSGPVANHVCEHGDGVRDIAFLVEDLDTVFAQVCEKGAEPILEPCSIDSGGQVSRKATVGGPCGIVHSLIQRDEALDGYLAKGRFVDTLNSTDAGFSTIDHLAICFELRQLQAAVDHYKSVFGFTVTYDDTVETKYSSMRSIVVENASGTVKLVLAAPLNTEGTSHLEQFLKHQNGPGVQHIAMLCDDVASTVQRLRQRGVEFVDIPNAYYRMLPARLGEVSTSVERLREVGLLLDRDEWGDLIQTFTKPVTSRPTLFLEFIQRNGARGFAAGNIRALTEAVELERH
jgi:4-hydroxyphenylpyruvate dioxygenase